MEQQEYSRYLNRGGRYFALFNTACAKASALLLPTTLCWKLNQSRTVLEAGRADYKFEFRHTVPSRTYDVWRRIWQRLTYSAPEVDHRNTNTWEHSSSKYLFHSDTSFLNGFGWAIVVISDELLSIRSSDDPLCFELGIFTLALHDYLVYSALAPSNLSFYYL